MVLNLTFEGKPITKKNHQQIWKNRKTGARFLTQSEAYKAYEADCIAQTPRGMKQQINQPCRVTCVYYMPDRRIVDITNLMAATHDILVKAGVLADDNSRIVCSVDGSRVELDKARPRVEISVASLEFGKLNNEEVAHD